MAGDEEEEEEEVWIRRMIVCGKGKTIKEVQEVVTIDKEIEKRDMEFFKEIVEKLAADFENGPREREGWLERADYIKREKVRLENESNVAEENENRLEESDGN